MSGEKTALGLALEARQAEAEPEDDEGQPDLLGLPISENLVLFHKAKVAGMPDAPRIGRPKGARNRRTLEMAEYLLSRYTSPLEILAQIAVRGVDELAASLGCTKLEALQEKRLAAIALKDHLHSKMPIAVNLNERREITLVIQEPPAQALLEAPAQDDEPGVGLVDVIAPLKPENPS